MLATKLLARVVLQRTAAQCVRSRPYHASAVTFARRGRRNTRGEAESKPVASAVFGGDKEDEKEEEDLGWLNDFNELEESRGKKADGDDDEMDAESKEFLKEIDELFTLESDDFEKRMATYGKKKKATYLGGPAVEEYDDDEEEDDDSDDDDDDDDSDDDAVNDDDFDEEEIERATERIPRRKLLKILEEVDSLKPTGGKNAEKMAIPKTKMAAPLEKKPKMNAEKISHRQEKVGLSLQDFVQHLLLQDADRHEINVFAQVLEVSVSPDLKRAVVFWEPARVQALDTPISKRKVAGVRSRLERMEKWVRAEVARHLNLKYAPIIQFKHKKESKENEARRIFDEEMKWLNRFE